MGFKLKKKNGSVNDSSGTKKSSAFLEKIRTQLDQTDSLSSFNRFSSSSYPLNLPLCQCSTFKPINS